MASNHLVHCPPLCHASCKIQHHPIILALINVKNTVSDQDFLGLEAVMKRYEQLGEWHKNGNIPDQNPDYRFPLLHWAASLGKVAVVKWLLGTKNCRAAEQWSENGDTVLHKMIYHLKDNKKMEIDQVVDIIREIVPYFKGNLILKDKNGNTPLHVCCHALQSDVSKAKKRYNNVWINFMMIVMDQHPRTLLNVAVNTQNNDGDTPLHLLAHSSSNYHILKDILEKYCKHEIFNLKLMNNEKLTVLDVAIKNGNCKIASFLNLFLQESSVSKKHSGNIASSVRQNRRICANLGEKMSKPTAPDHSYATSNTDWRDNTNKITVSNPPRQVPGLVVLTWTQKNNYNGATVSKTVKDKLKDKLEKHTEEIRTHPNLTSTHPRSLLNNKAISPVASPTHMQTVTATTPSGTVSAKATSSTNISTSKQALGYDKIIVQKLPPADCSQFKASAKTNDGLQIVTLFGDKTQNTTNLSDINMDVSDWTCTEQTMYDICSSGSTLSSPTVYGEDIPAKSPAVTSSNGKILATSPMATVSSTTPLIARTVDHLKTGMKRKEMSSVSSSSQEPPIKFIKVENDSDIEMSPGNPRMPSPVENLIHSSVSDSDLPQTSLTRRSMEPFPSSPSITSSGNTEQDIQLGKGIVSYLSMCSASVKQEFLEKLLKDKEDLKAQIADIDKQYKDARVKKIAHNSQIISRQKRVKYLLEKVVELQKDIHSMTEVTDSLNELMPNLVASKMKFAAQLDTCERAVLEISSML